jgi:hypothetical protein
MDSSKKCIYYKISLRREPKLQKKLWESGGNGNNTAQLLLTNQCHGAELLLKN